MRGGFVHNEILIGGLKAAAEGLGASTQREDTVKQNVLLKILEIIHAHGAEVALPTSTVHVPGGFAITQQTPPVSQEPD